jgi:hypothetical protein
VSESQEKALTLTEEMLVDAAELCKKQNKGGNDMEILVVALMLALNHHAVSMEKGLYRIWDAM